MIFGATNQFSPEDLVRHKWGKQYWIFADFWFKTIMSQGNMDKQSNHESEEKQNYTTNLSANSGEHPEESTGVFDRSVE